jgi:uncharacterized protein YkwD
MIRYLTLAAVAVIAYILAAPARHADKGDTERIEVPAVPDDSGKRPDLKDVARRVVDRTSAFRKEEGRDPVAVSDELTATARYFANHMARNDEYGHTADGNQPSDRAKRHGYDFCIVLENIAHAFDSRGFDAEPLADKFFTGWKESPGHRKNMLDPDVTETGVAVARSETTGHYYAVQLFGRPKSGAIVFKVENRSDEAVKYTTGGQEFELAPRVVRTHIHCRPAEVTFAWPGGKSEAVKPPTGGRLVVTRDGDSFAVQQAKE